MVVGEALGVIGRRIMSHFPHLLATEEVRQYCHDEIAAIPTLPLHVHSTVPLFSLSLDASTWK